MVTYQVGVLDPKATALLQEMAELGLISIGEEQMVALVKATIRQQLVVPDNIQELDKEIQENKFSQEKSYDPKRLPPLVKSMLGAFEATEDFDYKEELAKVLADKYLLNE